MLEESGEWRHIGAVERTDNIMSDIASGEAMLERTVQAGLFAPVATSVHERIDYFESVADWKDHLDRPHVRGFAGDERDLKRALARLDAGEECLRVESEFHIGTYVKPGV